ncbi:hypothetical protein NDU88_003330 [Pleurodeles waltl]|uniref:Uncharacterized protein n=1 Tax=Pleurodeles waltl TaxID=8319 RepID=A0AAV7MQW4_PLEWA|nr:hypothetical protein NDU88_003330 [Pleurodeles waltl]
MSGSAIHRNLNQNGQGEAGRFSPVLWENPDSSKLQAGKREVMEKFFTPLGQERPTKENKKNVSPLQERRWARSELFTTASSSPSSSSAWSSSPWSSEASIEREAFLVPSSRLPAQHSKSCVDLCGQGLTFHKDGQRFQESPGLSRRHSKSVDRLAHRGQRLSDEMRLHKATSRESSLASNEQAEVVVPQMHPRHLTVRSTGKGILKSGQSPRADIIRKAKSMEAITAKSVSKVAPLTRKSQEESQGSRKNAWKETVREKEGQSTDRAGMKKRYMEEKQRFSTFLNEITRQVLSPSSLTSLGLKQQHLSPSSHRKKHQSSSTDSSESKDSKSRGSSTGSIPDNLQARQKEGTGHFRPSRRACTSPDSCSVSSAPSMSWYSGGSRHRTASSGSKSPQQQASPGPGRRREESTSPVRDSLPSWQRGRPDHAKTAEPGRALDKNKSGNYARDTSESDTLSHYSPRQSSRLALQRKTTSSEDVSVRKLPQRLSQHGRQMKTDLCKDMSTGKQQPQEEGGRSTVAPVGQRRSSPAVEREVLSPVDGMTMSRKTATLQKEALVERDTRAAKEPLQARDQMMVLPETTPDHISCAIDALNAVDSGSSPSHGHCPPGKTELRDELDFLKERFTRLQEEYSSTQLTNHFLEEKLTIIAQTMAHERLSRNQRIAEILERLIASQNTASGLESPNNSSSLASFEQHLSLENKDITRQASSFDVPHVAPPIPFMDVAEETSRPLDMESSHNMNNFDCTTDAVPSVSTTVRTDLLDVQEQDPFVLLEREKLLEVLKGSPKAGSQSIAFTPWKQRTGLHFPSLEQFNISMESESFPEGISQTDTLQMPQLVDFRVEAVDEQTRRRVPSQEGSSPPGSVGNQRSHDSGIKFPHFTDTGATSHSQLSFLKTPLKNSAANDSTESSGDELQEDWLKILMEKQPNKKEKKSPIDYQSAQKILNSLVSSPIAEKEPYAIQETLSLGIRLPRFESVLDFEPYKILDCEYEPRMGTDIKHQAQKSAYHTRPLLDAVCQASEVSEVNYKHSATTVVVPLMLAEADGKVKYCHTWNLLFQERLSRIEERLHSKV